MPRGFFSEKNKTFCHPVLPAYDIIRHPFMSIHGKIFLFALSGWFAHAMIFPERILFGRIIFMNDRIQIFDNQPIRTAWDEEKEEWYL